MGAQVLQFDALCKKRDEWREAGMRVGLTNGCFDMLHPGHIFLLEQASKLCDVLVVALNSDSSVRTLKGPLRPIVPENMRAYELASVRWVSAVFIFNGLRVVEEIRCLSPDVYIRASDHDAINNLNSKELRALHDVGATIKIVKLLKGFSTTSIIERYIGASLLISSEKKL
jgi:rfaE bifunctional protein nucleotidyltransferase chain/domain